MLTSNKNSAPILIGALVLVLLFAMYYYIVMPKHDEVKTLQRSVSSVEQEIAYLQSQRDQLQSTQEDATDNLIALQAKVPTDKDIVELLLSMEEIGFKSQSKIVGIQFNSYDALVNQSELQDPNLSVSVESSTVADGQAEELPISPIAKESLPSELQMVTFNIDLESATEDHMSIFLKELEALERIVRIDAVNYSIPSEYDNSESKRVTAKIQATAFYYEG